MSRSASRQCQIGIESPAKIKCEAFPGISGVPDSST
jgi:hypothetical protein